MARSIRRRVLPGFRATLGFTIFYLILIVLGPLLTIPVRAASAGWGRFWETISDPRVVASYQLTLGAAFVAACVNAVFGVFVPWAFARYALPGRPLLDACTDLPSPLP